MAELYEEAFAAKATNETAVCSTAFWNLFFTKECGASCLLEGQQKLSIREQSEVQSLRKAFPLKTML